MSTTGQRGGGSMLAQPLTRPSGGRIAAYAGLFLLGAVIGAAGALVQSVLYGTQPSDPSVFASAAAALGVIALAAAYVPARRATASCATSTRSARRSRASCCP